MNDDRTAAYRWIKGALSGGNVLAAYDRALQELADHADDLQLQYLSVLALVRSGATGFAETRYRELGLDRTDADGQLGIDIGSLAGRIAKDRALAATDPAERQLQLQRAIAAYTMVVDRFGDSYPLINVAALRLWAGDPDGSREAAAQVLAHLAAVPEQKHDYWHFATSAEARLLTGDIATAGGEIAAAATWSGIGKQRKWQDLSVTRAQMRRSCHASGTHEAILAPLHVPPVVAYAGEPADADLGPEREIRLAEAIQAALAEDEPWIFFGGLRAGFEILLAEALIRRGAELNVVLPFPDDIFRDVAVRPHGEGWVARFEACLKDADTVRYATDYGYAGRTAPVHYARRLAMGHAILRAKRLDTSTVLIFGCEGRSDCLGAAKAWAQTGRTAVRVTQAGPERPDMDAIDAIAEPAADCIEVASLFGDFTGFSRLPEQAVGEYAERFLGGIAAVLDRYESVIARNSWGDAVVAQFKDVWQAARCAADIQAFLRRPENAKLADVDMRMRIGLHYGPVRPVDDRVQGRTSYLGTHVVRAARIEPVAIPGMIYVSEPFAAALAVDRRDDLVCDYLGILKTAKSFGEMSLYALREIHRT